ncbi:YncE family protein [Aquimarina longa]|uniref:YncE family protein n=1 Tax=Aquimarina longa TaxID=1080221 RepID=UPI000782724C|nr:YncE family protein [Aquimarina longa]
MKKSTEIALLTSIGLVALFTLLKCSSQKAKTKALDAEASSDEDGFITAAKHIDAKPTKVISESSKSLKNQRNKRPEKRLFKKTIATTNPSILQQQEKNQLTITNTSSIERAIHLWSGHKKPPLSPVLSGDIKDHSVHTISIENSTQPNIYPQGMLINPFNGYTYIANQLSSTISILNSDGSLIRSIAIHPSSAYGSSPVDLAVNSLADSPNYGKVYVANILNNTVSILTTTLEVENTIVVGVRPIGITFNTVNQQLYVANIGENTVSVLDATENLIATIPVGKYPRSIAFHPERGDSYVLNSGDNSITVLDQNNTAETTITDIGDGLTTAIFNPINAKLYVVSSRSNSVIPINLETHTKETEISVGAAPYRIVYNPNTELMYVGNRYDNTFSIINSIDQVIETLALGVVNTGVVVDIKNDLIYSTDTTGSSISLISYKKESSAVRINEEYYSNREDFTFNPVKIQHVKFVFSGTKRFEVLTLQKETIAGKASTHSISLSKYSSPQNFNTIAEVTEFKDTILNGRVGWLFSIAPKQTITIITYYRQIEMQQLLNYDMGIIKNKNR